MTLIGAFVLLYGILVLAGGVVGFMKAQSMASLIAGIVFGIVLILSGYWIIRESRYALYVAFTCSLLLALFFFYRYALTYKMMPAGMMGILSIIACLVLILERTMSRS